ncbi:MAG TPA: SpoIVB peptidase S55 domain-containing protein [Thermoanaerobaculia bacterium]|nr:SpoIVB peptidase S55 domain-containing protein [Thermoanaerobaculia bacterium]
MRRILRSLVLAGVLVGAAAFARAVPTDILPAGEITPGMKGYGFSDFGDGKGVQRFDVEIIGLLKSYAPKQDLILARVAGSNLEKTGIIAGMSGSPIYVDGKLVGALAYGWPFSRDPICGITPIQSMLDIRKAPAAPPVPIGGAATRVSAFVSAFKDRSFAAPFAALLAPLKAEPASAGPSPLPLPVSLSGPVRPGKLFDEIAESSGWLVAPAGASAAAASSPGASPATLDAGSHLEPGSAVAAVLLSGDMVLSATGTVTWVDGNSVLAFGHPFLSMGPVDMPMASADVLTVLPSIYRSFKFATTGPVLGSVSQDRSTGILGNFGGAPKMVPVTIRLTSEDLPTQTFRFEVVHNSMLTPILLGLAVDNVLTTLEKRAGERTIVWKSAIDTPDRTVRWDSVFSGLGAKDDAVASLALLTNFLMANEFRDLPIRGVDVEITHSDRLQSARMVHVEAQKERVRPGETVPVWVDLEDFRGGPRRVVLNARIPDDAPPGPLTVFIGDGNAATAYDLSLFPPDPHSLDQVLDFLGRVRPANTVNLIAYRPAAGALVNGEALAGLPPSRAAILHDRAPGDGTPDLGYLRLQSESVEQPVPVAGSARLTLEVLPRTW